MGPRRTSPDPVATRRRFLIGSGAALAALAAGCGDDGGGGSAASTTTGATTAPSSTPTTGDVAPAPASPGTAPTTLTAADFADLTTCPLLPELTPGPFPTREQLERRAIDEGYPGRPLRLGLRVVDDGCDPVAGAVVEVWHTDATGDYSSYTDGGGGKDEAEGTTFCRGFQVADDAGIVELRTIYPGWYPGRAVHVHVRVRVDDRLVLTTQLFFPDDVTAAVFADEPYAQHGLPDTTNATDGFGGDIATNGTLLATSDDPTTAATGTLARALLGVSA